MFLEQFLQAVVGVTPDLACFGKGLANGFPVSAVAGRRDVMMVMEEIFFSFTFGGEMLSLAAARAVLQKLTREPVLQSIAAAGERLGAGIKALLEDDDLRQVFDLRGHPSWTFLTIADQPNASAMEIKTLLMQELHQRGILWVGTHNLNLAHGNAEIDALLDAYRAVLPMIAAHAKAGNVVAQLRCDPLVPLFKVR